MTLSIVSAPVDHAAGARLAAEAATEATVALLRFQREGQSASFPFDDPEPVAMLAVALVRTIRIESALFPREALINDPAPSAEYLSALNQLVGACLKFLDDQCKMTVPEATAAA